MVIPTTGNKLSGPVLKTVLGPVLLLQGLWVRLRTPRLPEAQGPRQGRTGAGPRLRLLVLGDSSAAGVGVASQSEALLGQLTHTLGQVYTVHYRLEAQTGATTAGAIDRLDPQGTETVDAVVTALGVNDLTAGRRLPDWLADQKRLIDCLRARMRPRVIMLSGLPPVHLFPALPLPLRWYLGAGARAYSTALEDLARRQGVLFLPLDFSMDVSQMATDGFHPGRGVYREWARRAASGLVAALDGDGSGASETAPTPQPRPRVTPGAGPGANRSSHLDSKPCEAFDPCSDC